MLAHAELERAVRRIALRLGFRSVRAHAGAPIAHRAFKDCHHSHSRFAVDQSAGVLSESESRAGLHLTMSSFPSKLLYQLHYLENAGGTHRVTARQETTACVDGQRAAE